MTQVENCIIKKVSIDVERGCCFWVHLDYGCAGQAFGGIMCDGDLLQRFIVSLCKTFDVLTWEDLAGKSARAEHDHVKVYQLGHFLKDRWTVVDDIVAQWREES